MITKKLFVNIQILLPKNLILFLIIHTIIYISVISYNIHDPLFLVYKIWEKYFNKNRHTSEQNMLSYKCLRNTAILISVNIVDSPTPFHSLVVKSEVLPLFA